MKFLLANDIEELRRLRHVLANFDFCAVSTLKDALALLESAEKFDAIVAGVYFDESRAVELLREVRARPQYSSIPFLFIRTRSSSLARIIEQSISSLKDAYEISGFIETDHLREDDGAICKAILDCIAIHKSKE